MGPDFSLTPLKSYERTVHEGSSENEEEAKTENELSFLSLTFFIIRCILLDTSKSSRLTLMSL